MHFPSSDQLAEIQKVNQIKIKKLALHDFFYANKQVRKILSESIHQVAS